jgi:hypothetical protein
MSAVTDLEIKVQSLEDQLRDARESLEKARLLEYPVKIGQLVTSRGKVYRLSSFNFRYANRGKPWARGEMRKKDGSFGVVRELFSDWELLKETEKLL